MVLTFHERTRTFINLCYIKINMINKVIRKLSASGKYSKFLNLPREFLKKLGWRENQNLEIELDEKKKRLIIKDAK